MPKSIIVEPEKVLAKDNIHFSDIPVNVYDKPVEEELATYSREDLLHIFRDMCIVREFENTLNQIKLEGAHKRGHLCAPWAGAPFNRTGSGRGRHGVLARTRRPYLWLTPQSRRDPSQGSVGDSPDE